MRLLRPPGVYAPLEDTELLARVTREEPRTLGADVLDVGTGTGALALVAAECGAASVTATDLSRRAVLAARVNARLRGHPIRVHRGDLLSSLAGRSFDLILSNPPYVASPGGVPVRGADLAWWAGADGRAVLDRLCVQAPPLLRDGGVLLLVQSALSGVGPTVAALAAQGLRAEPVARETVPYGPVMRRHAAWLEAQGLVDPGETKEELVVIRAWRD
ncbi:HemK2/MTQ2 family protein methyltransferase [Streptomyces chryseus]|uniref:Methyltransferase n=1 Tax=Streptomyces chryseus TaxID=68186 RepID=A0ABQ3DNB3_9ACTN|nr:HemK2/MTQ2 family protein methyltransferase [Streptomyces chryseus]GGX10394.1 methyltransferase [Streptomyces chryseus]GHB01270.1 methyltransferase [Streptomyces chryseus]